MASFSRTTARQAALGIAAAAAMVTSASAADFTQAQCKGITGTAMEVVRTVGKDTLSQEFRQSFRNWLGADLHCDGPKDIIIVTHNDSIAYGAIRSALLTGSKPISLQKAGLRVVVKPAEVVSAVPPTQTRSGTAPVPAVN